ncbi:MAG: hypothetical protein ACI9JN_001788 [Bacteroidia bacterium]|jgi:hypothetical protein
MKTTLNLHKILLLLSCTTFLLGRTTMLHAQSQGSGDVVITIPQASSIHVNGLNGSSIQLTPTAPANAGLPLNFTAATNNSLWLNYSAISQEGKDIYVIITSGTLPDGLALKVNANVLSSAGQGNFGAAAGTVFITAAGQCIVKGITTCYTGEGPTLGRQLAYTLVNTGQYAQIQTMENNIVTVCYTITD